MITSLPGRPVRLMLTELDSPEIFEVERNYEANAFIWGGSTPELMYGSGSYEVRFSDIQLPAWSNLPDEFQRPIDASRLHSFQFLVPNNPSDAYQDYYFCVLDVAWVDACGNAIAVSIPAETSPVVSVVPTPDPTTSAPDSTFPAFDSTSGPDVITLDPISSAPLETSDPFVTSAAPWASDAGAADTFVDEPPANDASVQ